MARREAAVMAVPGIPIRVSALITRTDGEKREWLLVRGEEDTQWMLPGGLVEPGEVPSAAIVRQIHEELGIMTFPKVKPDVIWFTEPSSPDRPGEMTFLYDLGDPLDPLVRPQTSRIADWTWRDWVEVCHNTDEYLNAGDAARVFEWDTIGQLSRTATLYLEQRRNGAVQS
jgi:ADP-ribose pyrophosphatase YjhB (NUDIX family)